MEWTEQNRGRHHKRAKTNSSLTPRAHSIKSQLWFFPDVLAKLILTYDYNFDGTVDWEPRSNSKRIEFASDFSDGRVITVIGNSVTVWDGTGNSLWTLRLGTYICRLKVLPCDIFLVHSQIGQWNCAVTLFDSNTYNCLVVFPAAHFEVLQPDQADEEDGTVRIVKFFLRPRNGFEVFSYKRGSPSLPTQTGTVEEPIKLEMSTVLPNNKFVVITVDGQLKHWVYVFQCVANKMTRMSRQGIHDLCDLRFCAPVLDGVLVGGRSVTVRSPDDALLVFKNLKTGIEFGVPNVSGGSLLGQSRLLCCSDNEILIFDLATQQKQITLREFDLRRNRFVVLPNGDLAVSDTCVCQAIDLEVYNTETGVKERTIHVAPPQFVEGINHVSVATCKRPRPPIANMAVLPSGRLAWFGAVLQIYS